MSRKEKFLEQYESRFNEFRKIEFDSIKEIHRVVTLHGLGAGFFFRSVIP